MESEVGGGGGIVLIVQLILLIVVVAGSWKMYQKAGRQGWECLIPFYNFFVLLGIIGKPWWWFLLLFIPIVNFVIMILIWNGVSKAFGKGIPFTLGL
ncbi:MAG: hypothetical protein KDD53_08490, partial [Bdellovibrionales bacterium]|nr:hypothetical protein [Bdellovibrionales bacterium]